MKDFVKIPVGLILEMDDVGWIDGRDLRAEGKASRSGLDRNHVIEDYVHLKNLTKTIGKNVAAAIVVADWDKENVLRGEVGITHDPEGWDQASKLDVEAHQKCLEVLDEAGVDYMLHGVLHGRYDENGKCVSECEHLETIGDPRSKNLTRFLASEEDLRRRLDLFFKIYKSSLICSNRMVMVVPSPTTDWISNLSEHFTILGKPIPAPKPIWRTWSGAVDQPSCNAFSISGMPGPLSVTVITVASEKASAATLPPPA